MAQKLEDWIKTHVFEYDKLPPKEISYNRFFREECRPVHINSDTFYSPADGIILYQKLVRPNDKILEVKGIDYNLCNILMDDELPDIEYYVIGVFMTLYSIHSNRIPFSGYLKYEHLPPIKSLNLPMIFMEKDIFTNKINFKDRDYSYLFNNARCVNTIFSPKLNLSYQVVQIADVDVDVITPFSQKQNVWKNSGERFSFIRFGSQCELIVPKVRGMEFEFCQEEFVVIEGANDPLLKRIK